MKKPHGRYFRKEKTMLPRRAGLQQRQTSGKLSQRRRNALAANIRAHRKSNFTWDYMKMRDFAHINRSGFDIKGFLSELVAKQKGAPLRVLNSGAGHLGIEGDIKKQFGKRVHVSSLNVIHPATTAAEQERIFEKNLKDIGAKSQDTYQSYQIENMTNMEHLKRNSRTHTSARAKLVDEIIVSSAERHAPKAKYDVIFDLFGPLQYSDFPKVILRNYALALRPNGEIVTNNASLLRTVDEIRGQVYRDPSTGKKFRFALAESKFLNPNIHLYAIVKKEFIE